MEKERDRPVLSIIAAAARNGAIGKGGAMPWHLPGDLRYFKAKTSGKPVIMGRETWNSLKYKPLPGRVNIILTRQKDWRADGAYPEHSLQEAIDYAVWCAQSVNAEEIFVIGGGEIFRQALPLADKIYLTEIQADIDGDTFFKPDLSPEYWDKIEESSTQQGEKDSHSYRLSVYQRTARSPE